MGITTTVTTEAMAAMTVGLALALVCSQVQFLAAQSQTRLIPTTTDHIPHPTLLIPHLIRMVMDRCMRLADNRASTQRAKYLVQISALSNSE